MNFLSSKAIFTVIFLLSSFSTNSNSPTISSNTEKINVINEQLHSEIINSTDCLIENQVDLKEAIGEVLGNELVDKMINIFYDEAFFHKVDLQTLTTTNIVEAVFYIINCNKLNKFARDIFQQDSINALIHDGISRIPSEQQNEIYAFGNGLNTRLATNFNNADDKEIKEKFKKLAIQLSTKAITSNSTSNDPVFNNLITSLSLILSHHYLEQATSNRSRNIPRVSLYKKIKSVILKKILLFGSKVKIDESIMFDTAAAHVNVDSTVYVPWKSLITNSGFSLLHELGHATHKDFNKLTNLYLGLTTFLHAVANLDIPAETKLTLLILAPLIELFFLKIAEYEADSFAIEHSTPSELKAYRPDFVNHHNERFAVISETYEICNQIGKRKSLFVYDLFFDEHPSSLSRAIRIETAIKDSL